MFWKQKPLAQLSDDEWESLCDGCGQCCFSWLPTTCAYRLLQAGAAMQYPHLVSPCRITFIGISLIQHFFRPSEVRF